MKLVIYPLLNVRSQRAMRRTKKRWGHPYTYQPRRRLITRLSVQLGWSEQQVIETIEKERAFILKHLSYFQN
jgi:hypothetical protein